MAGRSLVVRANGGLSDHVTKPWEPSWGSTLINAQFSALDTSAERGTSDETEDTHQRVYDQRLRLEAADCEGM